MGFTTPFLDGWSVWDERSGTTEPVVLPHDAMIAERRGPDEESWAHGAYFPGGRYRYRRTWTPGPETAGRCVRLVFEGVYRDSRVLLDGREVGGATNGYREFEVRLDPHVVPGREHVLEVDVDNTLTPSARWYTGSGIYRPVWLDVRDPVHVVAGGTRVLTRLAGARAHVSIEAELANHHGADLRLDVELRRTGRLVARGTGTTSGTSASIELVVDDPDLWSADRPALHELDLTLHQRGVEVDRRTETVGLRTLELDPRRGLLVNGEVVLLRGANVHHDHGVLGAVTLPGAERRRVQILKDAGFTAIRSAHNPASRALLQACDELGVYVMDEVFDGWYDHKTTHDDADRFEGTWRAEVQAVVRKDRLHPCVLMYSIGNENGEALTPRGRRVAAEMTAELRRCDPTRFTTIGVNLVAATFAGLAKSHLKDVTETSAKTAPDMTSTALNVISNRFGLLMKRLPRLRAADRATRELFDLVDVAGYNYGTSRYRVDAREHPGRLVVGTESMPGDLARNWELVEALTPLIGDFVWAGWDYLGEAGGGTWSYGTRRAPFLKPYPQLTSGMGIIDITGVPGAAVLLAQAAWGELEAPGIAVRPLDVAPGPVARTAWRATDAVASWSWAGHEGRRAEVEVYSADDEVELLVNGRSAGRRPAGRAHGYLARFTAPYEPGALEAVAFRDGVAVSRSQLRTAGAAALRLRVEGPLRAGPQECAFVWVELADADGVIDSTATDVVGVQVEGPAVLGGLGSAAPQTEESFADAVHSTHRGRALAVVRSTGGTGAVRITATSTSHGTDTTALVVQP